MPQSLKRIYAVFVRQLYLYRGNPIRLISVFLWVVLDIILWGFISKYLGSLGEATFSFVNAVLGAIILWDFLGRVMQGTMTAFLEDVWTQNFINFFASPLRLAEYIAGLVVTGLTLGIIGFLVMAGLAGLAFGYDVFKIGLAIMPFLLVLFVFAVSLGIFMTAIILRFGPAAEWLGWPIPFATSVFSGVFYPVTVLPSPLQLISKIIPAAYVFESLRSITSGSGDPRLLNNFLIGFCLALIYLAAMCLLLYIIYRRNLKNGQLSRFSAE